MNGPRRRLLNLVALLTFAPIGWAQTVAWNGNGELLLANLPPVLQDEKVAPELTKGLTTTFLFRVDLVRGEARSGARIQLRYELWDEVFQLVAIGADGKAHRHQVGSMAALESWWSALQIPILGPADHDSTSGRIRIYLDIIPFSHAEEVDTQRWFAESVRRAEVGAVESSGGVGGTDSLDDAGIIELLIATSIRRRPLMTYQWNLPVPDPLDP